MYLHKIVKYIFSRILIYYFTNIVIVTILIILNDWRYSRFGFLEIKRLTFKTTTGRYYNIYLIHYSISFII